MNWRAAGATALAVALTVPFALPFAYLLVRNAGDLSGLWGAVSDNHLVGPLLRSLVLGASVALAAAVLGTAAAWLVARTDLRARRTWALLLCLPLVIPSFVGAVALIAAFAPGGLVEQVLGIGFLPEVSGFGGAFVVLTLLTYPYVFLLVMARLRTLSPSLEESARMLGRRPLQVFTTVVLPQARAAVAAGALLVFLYVISDFGAVQLLRYDTLTRAIYSDRLLDPTTSIALSLVLGVIAVAVVAMERRSSRVGLRDQARAGAVLHVPLGAWRLPAYLFLVLLIGFALVAPIAVLAFWAIRGLANGSADTASVVADPGLIVQPLLSTAGISVVTALVAIAIVLPIAYRSVRRPGRLGEVLAGTVVGGFALPGLVTALAFVFFTLATPGPLGALYQTLPLLVLAYVVHHGALALGAAQSAVAGIPARLDDAARIMGRNRIRRFIGVEVPLMLPGLAAGAGLVLLSTAKELPATLLLAPPGFSTLAIKVWQAAELAAYEEAAIFALVLVAISAVLTWFLVVRPALRSWTTPVSGTLPSGTESPVSGSHPEVTAP
ncbi:MAG: iron ABC transporter permease [Acidobacteria bacterium]|nr:iron ABC transporter permease [Acidobacteriota bacterium]